MILGLTVRGVKRPPMPFCPTPEGAVLPHCDFILNEMAWTKLGAFTATLCNINTVCKGMLINFIPKSRKSLSYILREGL